MKAAIALWFSVSLVGCLAPVHFVREAKGGAVVGEVYACVLTPKRTFDCTTFADMMANTGSVRAHLNGE